MPTSVPFHPGLVLGEIVPQAILDNLLAIAREQAPIDAVQEKLNSLFELQRSLEMTSRELADMDVDTSDLTAKIADVKTQIKNAAVEMATVRIEQETKIQALRAKMPLVNASVESPVDFNRTQIKQMPLSADSIKMDAQYFSFDSETQDSASVISSIKGYVAESTTFLGAKRSENFAASASAQASSQYENHNIAGTLVITASCTHKQAVVLAPFVIDVDKAIRAWNSIFKKSGPLLNKNNPASLVAAIAEEGTADEVSLNLLSGASYGSSFVGMVHVLRNESTSSSQAMVTAAASLQEQFDVGCAIASASGGAGIDASFASDIKQLLSTQKVSSHISIVTMGAIPSIKSNEVQIGVKQFADFDPAKMMGQLAIMSNNNRDEQKTVSSSAEQARAGGQMLAIENNKVQSVMAGLGAIDDGKNKMLDINSLMTAFEDYVNGALEGKAGVPLNYYLKPVTRAELAQMWLAKYFPNLLKTESGDDSGGNDTTPKPQPTT